MKPSYYSEPKQEVTPQAIFGRNHRQLEAWRESELHRFLLYGGAAGGGKSFFLRWWAVFYSLYLYVRLGIRGSQVMLACESYPALLDRQVSKIRAEFPRELGELKQGVTLDYELRPEYGGGRILLRNLDDPSKYLSSEFAGIAVDELSRNDRGVFDLLRLRLRWPGVDRPRFVGGSNPGGKGHGWVKSLWIERKFPVELTPLAQEFYFVPAKMQDNPFLPDSYYQDLLTLPEDMARAFAAGDWNLFAGQYFKNFAESKHVDREESWQVKPWWPRWISIDWGFEHPSCVYWHAMGDDEVTRTYRELHKNRLSPQALAKQIAESSKGEKIDSVYLSPDAFAHKTDELSIAEQIGDELAYHGLPRPERADDDRVGGWMLMYQMLEAGYWRIGSSCKELIRAIPQATRDERKVEDIAKWDATNGEGGDDPIDCARYGLKTRHGIGKKPLEVRVKERIKSASDRMVELGHKPITDPTAIAMVSQEAVIAEKKKAKPIPVFRPRYARFLNRSRRMN